MTWNGFCAQVAHLEILARLYILRYQYAEAAAVYETLAARRQGLGDESVDLPERVELYRSAVLQVHSLPRLSLLALDTLSGRGNTAMRQPRLLLLRAT